jgi:hypothetical protein
MSSDVSWDRYWNSVFGVVYEDRYIWVFFLFEKNFFCHKLMIRLILQRWVEDLLGTLCGSGRWKI